MSSDPKNSKM